MNVLDVLKEDAPHTGFIYYVYDKNEKYIGSLIPYGENLYHYHFYKRFSKYNFRQNNSFYNWLQFLLYSKVAKREWEVPHSTKLIYLKDFDLFSDEGRFYFEMEKDAICEFELVAGEFIQVKSEEHRTPTTQELKDVYLS